MAGYFTLDESINAIVPMILLFKKYPPPKVIPRPSSVPILKNTFDELSAATMYAAVPVLKEVSL